MEFFEARADLQTGLVFLYAVGGNVK